MYAILVHRYNPDTVYFIVNESDNTALYEHKNDVYDYVKDHPLKRVVEWFCYNLEKDSVERIFV